jgi:hypothetical protein
MAGTRRRRRDPEGQKTERDRRLGPKARHAHERPPAEPPLPNRAEAESAAAPDWRPSDKYDG